MARPGSRRRVAPAARGGNADERNDRSRCAALVRGLARPAGRTARCLAARTIAARCAARTRAAPAAGRGRARRLPRERAGGARSRGIPDPRRPCRQLPAAVAAGCRRDGRGLPRAPRRRQLPAGGGGQADPSAAPGGLTRIPPADAGPLRPGTDPAGAPAASQHRPHPRRRPHRGRHPVAGDGVRRRQLADRLLRTQPARPARAPATVPEGLRRRAGGAPAPDRASRPEAGQHPGHPRRRTQAARLRHRTHPAGRQRGAAGDRTHRDDAGLRQPRAHAPATADHRFRRLFAGRAAVPAAGRHAPVRARRIESGRSRTHRLRRHATVDPHAARARRPAGARRAGRRRSRTGGCARHAQGRDAALRHRAGTGRRHRTLAGRQAGAGASGFAAVPPAQVRRPPSAGRGRGRAGADRGAGRIRVRAVAGAPGPAGGGRHARDERLPARRAEDLGSVRCRPRADHERGAGRSRQDHRRAFRHAP